LLQMTAVGKRAIGKAVSGSDGGRELVAIRTGGISSA